LTAGFSKLCISPRESLPLCGFGARNGLSAGIHDDIYVRALFLEAGGNAALLMSADLIALSQSFVEPVRNSISARTGIRPEAILMACTHTHAAPVTFTIFAHPHLSADPAYLEQLARAFEDCAATACERRFTARIGIGNGKVQDLGRNRRTADGLPVDEAVGIVRVDDSEGRTKVIAVNYACHPTVLGPDNLLVSGDFPASTVQRIEDALGTGSMAMFINGAQGNIGPGHSAELSAIGVIAPGRTFARAEELGTKLATAALEFWPRIQTDTDTAIGALIAKVRLPRKPLPSPAAAEQMLLDAQKRLNDIKQKDSPEFREASSAALYASITRYYAGQVSANEASEIPVELQGIRIGNTTWIAVPAEVFVEIGLRLKHEARRPTFLAGVANGYIGYFPCRSAFPAGGYEVAAAQVGPEAEDLFLQSALALEENLHAA